MKRFLLAMAILTTAAASFVALSNTATRGQLRLRAGQSDLRNLTKQLVQVQAERSVLAAKVRELQRERRFDLSTASIEPVVAEFLLTNDIKRASPEMQDKILAQFGPGGKSSANYVLVSKAGLKTITLKPLKTLPDGQTLTDAVRGVLAITPEEARAVEAAFAHAFENIITWAKAMVQREGPSGEMLVRYTIPPDPAFEQASTEKLFSTISAAIGDERAQLLRGYFEYNRYSEDGAIGNRANILEIHRISGQPGLGYRSGWKWEDSETINTYPEPIKPNKFPAAFRLIFPGGWQEVAQREGFDLPEEFTRKP